MQVRQLTVSHFRGIVSRSMLQVSGTIGVCITHNSPGLGRVSVALTHAHIVLTSAHGPAFKFETDL